MNNYNWRCQCCKERNLAQDDKCAKCGFPAEFTMAQLEAALPKEEKTPRTKKRKNKHIKYFIYEVAAYMLIILVFFIFMAALSKC